MHCLSQLRDVHGTTKVRKTALFKNLIKQSQELKFFVDQIISAQPGLIPQIAGFLTSKPISGCTTFIDRISDYIYVHLMKDLMLPETLLAKMIFEQLCTRANRSIKFYRADVNSQTQHSLPPAIISTKQWSFCGVGAQHQNKFFENRNKQLTQ